MTLPSATTRVSTQAGSAPVATDLIAVFAPVTTLDDGVPRFYANLSDLVGAHGYSEAAEYVGLPGDRILFVAHDPSTGICCGGRDKYEDSKHDAQGMNAAWWLGYAAAMEVIKARAAQCDMDFYG